MKIAFYASSRDNRPSTSDLDWPSLVSVLSQHRRTLCGAPGAVCPGKHCPAKNGPAWSPVDIEGTRLNANVRAVTVAVFDLDHLTEAAVKSAFTPIEAAGYAYAVHSSHSSRPPGDYCLRLVMPVTRPIAPKEWPVVREAAIRQFGLPADPGVKDLSRLYYLPSAPEGAPVLVATNEGRPLDVDAFYEAGKAGSSALIAPAPLPTEPLPADGQAADLYELRARLRQVRKPESVELLRRLFAGEALPVGERDNTMQRLASLLRFALPAETPEDAILEIVRPTFEATDWAGFDDPIGAMRVKLQRAGSDRAKRDADRAARNRLIAERLGKALLREPKPTDVPEAEDDPDPNAWGLLLETHEVKGELRLRNSEANWKLVLSESPEWKGVLRFNEVTKELEVNGGPITAPRQSTLHAEIAFWMCLSEYGKLGLQPKIGQMPSVIAAVAERNAYDPLRDYLLALKWDGVARIGDLLIRYFGAETKDRSGKDITDYVRTVGAKWLVGAVARALEPGCKMDTVLVLEGRQGIRKSSAFRILGGDWFTDAAIDVQNKDSAMLASSYWLIEMAELDTLRKGEASALKAFFSRLEDTYRPPYGRTTIKVPRRCVFVGTTNTDAYLKDPTGNRRFWPVRCTAIDLDALKRDRNQLWAESVARYHTGEAWWLDHQQASGAEGEANDREEYSPYVEIIQTYFLRMPFDKRPKEVSLAGIATDAFGFEKGEIDRSRAIEIGRALASLGFERFDKRDKGAKLRLYRTPQPLLEVYEPDSRKGPSTFLHMLKGGQVPEPKP